MTTSTATSSAAVGRVLAVGSLKPSLARTLSTTYDALVLPKEGPERDSFLAEYGVRSASSSPPAARASAPNS
ncbi:hypothetical protein ACOKM3_14610 [Streptomyces sp. BH106]|uniref:hypothetical protein n=1 Tax=Streptomyces sp. BH106 TaxID=3410409 RepID=UPI003CF5BE59